MGPAHVTLCLTLPHIPRASVWETSILIGGDVFDWKTLPTSKKESAGFRQSFSKGEKKVKPTLAFPCFTGEAHITDAPMSGVIIAGYLGAEARSWRKEYGGD